ncbi:MAG: VanW family protein [Labilithrix sp.]|nr:VanW family protein [Labilithrix sp.]
MSLGEKVVSKLHVLRPRGRRDLARVLVCSLVGGLAGWIAVPGRPVPLAEAEVVPEVTLDGTPLPIVEGDPAKTLEVARTIARAYVAREVSVVVPGTAITRTREELGARVEPARLASLVSQLVDRRSAMRRAHAQHAAAGVARPLALPLPVTIDDERALAELLTVKDDLDKAPVDARLDLSRRAVAPDESGRRVDVYATLARLDAALVHGAPALEAVVETVPAARTAASIGEVAFDDVLGFFETRYTPDRKHADRTFNLRLAASKLDGHVVMPGETFDFNEVVGPRSEANGYKAATVIAQGELVDGIGGGTCQIAGTLHGAAYFAGLDVVERRPHTRPSFYIKMGMDAAVVYPTITLRLRNPFSFPIVLHEKVEDGVVRAEILGPKRTRDVTFVRKINDVVPFVESERPDPKIPKGQRVLSQRGIPGFKVTRYRILRDGAVAVRERATDTYPPTAQIWRVGTGEDDPKFVAAGDEHPEYVADEYLSISQGPHVVDPRARPGDEPRPGGPMVETRVAGKYGTRGWTVREGFAKRVD